MLLKCHRLSLLSQTLSARPRVISLCTAILLPEKDEKLSLLNKLLVFGPNQYSGLVTFTVVVVFCRPLARVRVCECVYVCVCVCACMYVCVCDLLNLNRIFWLCSMRAILYFRHFTVTGSPSPIHRGIHSHPGVLLHWVWRVQRCAARSVTHWRELCSVDTEIWIWELFNASSWI